MPSVGAPERRMERRASERRSAERPGVERPSAERPSAERLSAEHPSVVCPGVERPTPLNRRAERRASERRASVCRRAPECRASERHVPARCPRSIMSRSPPTTPAGRTVGGADGTWRKVNERGTRWGQRLLEKKGTANSAKHSGGGASGALKHPKCHKTAAFGCRWPQTGVPENYGNIFAGAGLPTYLACVHARFFACCFRLFFFDLVVVCI